jgi:magnesium-transporting ATPase (P-type)
MAVDWEGEGIKNGVLILAVVLVNSVIGFVQEFRQAKPSRRSARWLR